MIKVKRIYEPASADDGFRILVDRLWPRGMKKETAEFDLWMKDIAPSTDLRKWFDHDPKKWPSFLAKYKGELKSSPAIKELRSLMKKHQTITLLYAAKDEEHNQAIALKKIVGGR